MMVNGETLYTKKPKSEIIRRYISYYFFHTVKSDAIQEKKIIFYPNTIGGLSIYKNMELIFNEDGSGATGVSSDRDFNLYYSTPIRKPFIKTLTVPFDKVGIGLKPLSLNHFVTEDMREIFPGEGYICFDLFYKKMKPTLHFMDRAESLEEKVEILDAFFLSIINDFKNSQIEHALNIIHGTRNRISVQEIAAMLEISPKTLGRRFQKFLNCNVKEYILIHRFRSSFNYFIKNKMKVKFTDLVSKFNYYDQQELIKQYKKMTGVNPKKLFENIEEVDEEGLFWNLNLDPFNRDILKES